MMIISVNEQKVRSLCKFLYVVFKKISGADPETVFIRLWFFISKIIYILSKEITVVSANQFISVKL